MNDDLDRADDTLDVPVREAPTSTFTEIAAASVYESAEARDPEQADVPLTDEQIVACVDAMQAVYLQRASNRRAARLLKKNIRRVLANRRERLPLGALRDGRVIAIHGKARAGKSALVERLLAGEPKLTDPGDGHTIIAINVQIKGPSTLRSVGLQLLDALGYKPQNRMDEGPVWDLVYTRLRLCNTLVVHLGEVANISGTANSPERKKLRNTIKSLVINELHPIVLILSGLSEIIPFLQEDEQVWERSSQVVVEMLQPEHAEALAEGITQVADAVGLAVHREELQYEIVPRLMFTSNYRLGLAMELAVGSGLQALEPMDNAGRILPPDRELKMRHFAAEYAELTGAGDAFNPFVVSNWATLECNETGILLTSQLDASDEDFDEENGAKPSRERSRKKGVGK